MHDLSWNGALKPIFIRQQAWKILMGSPYLPSASNPFSLSQLQIESFQAARGVVVPHPLSMREALGSIPSVSILLWASIGEKIKIAERGFDPRTFGL